MVDLTNRYLSLAKDEKFMKLSKNLGKEYEEAFSKLVQTAEAKLVSQVKSSQIKLSNTHLLIKHINATYGLV